MKNMLLVLAALLLLLPSAASAKPMEVKVILGLLDAGVSDLSIQRYVDRNGFTFDLSADDLVALKKAGASDALIEFLQTRVEGSAPQTQGESGTVSGTAEEPGYAVASPDYGTAYYGPSYSFGLSFGYPYYYYGYYYPYYAGYYYPPYYYPYYYPYGGYRYYGHGSHGGGTGVVSYWGHNHSGGGSYRPPAGVAPHPSAPRGGSSGGHSSGGHGGGHGGGRGGGRH